MPSRLSDCTCQTTLREPGVNLLLTISLLHLGNRKLTKITIVLTKPRPIRLKGRSFLALSLTPELPFEDWLAGLDDLAARSAGFFLRRPVVLDISGLDIKKAELRTLVDELSQRKRPRHGPRRRAALAAWPGHAAGHE